MEPNCACGHAEDEHLEPKKKGASAPCGVKGCPCICYEWDGNEGEDE
jgi:hypothetical protein